MAGRRQVKGISTPSIHCIEIILQTFPILHNFPFSRKLKIEFNSKDEETIFVFCVLCLTACEQQQLKQ